MTCSPRTKRTCGRFHCESCTANAVEQSKRRQPVGVFVLLATVRLEAGMHDQQINTVHKSPPPNCSRSSESSNSSSTVKTFLVHHLRHAPSTCSPSSQSQPCHLGDNGLLFWALLPLWTRITEPIHTLYFVPPSHWTSQNYLHLNMTFKIDSNTWVLVLSALNCFWHVYPPLLWNLGL